MKQQGVDLYFYSLLSHCKESSTGLQCYLHGTTNQACQSIVADGAHEIRLNDGLTLNDCLPDCYEDKLNQDLD